MAVSPVFLLVLALQVSSPTPGAAILGLTPSEHCISSPSSCKYNHGTAASETRHFVHGLINETETRGLSLTSRPRKAATVFLAKAAVESCIPGDIVETGTYTGGTSAMIMRTLMDLDDCGRKFWAFDSFQGFPDISTKDGAGADVPPNMKVGALGEFPVSQEVFEQNLKALNAWDLRIHVVKGFFNESIPRVSSQIPSIAFLRLDGDLYESTIQPLNLLYDKVNVGGLIYVDDYGSFYGCRRAIDEFRASHGITSLIHDIVESGWGGVNNGWVEAVWWKKE